MDRPHQVTVVLSSISPFIFTLLLSSAQLAVSEKTNYLALDVCNMCLHIVFPLLMLMYFYQTYGCRPFLFLAAFGV